MATHHWVVGSAVALSLTIVGIDNVAEATTAIPKGSVKLSYQILGKTTETYERDFSSTQLTCDGALASDAPAYLDWWLDQYGGGWYGDGDTSAGLSEYLGEFCEGEVVEVDTSFFPETFSRSVTYFRITRTVSGLGPGWSANCPPEAYGAIGGRVDGWPTLLTNGPIGIEPSNSFNTSAWEYQGNFTWDVSIVTSDTYGNYQLGSRFKPAFETAVVICGPSNATPSGIGVHVLRTTLTLPEVRRW